MQKINSPETSFDSNEAVRVQKLPQRRTMGTQSPLTVIILAAGKGTRMKSGKAKVLHPVFGAPMIHHVLDATGDLAAAQTIVIVGHQREAVVEALTAYTITPVLQEEQLGTGHAVAIAENSVSTDIETVMILCGDTPLIQPDTLCAMYTSHKQSGAALTVMTTLLANPTNYGRIVSDDDNRVIGIVEEKDATSAQKKIREINAGIYCVERSFLFKALQQVGTDNSQGEVYLTDIVGIAVNQGLQVDKYVAASSDDVLGVNSRVELAQADSELQKRRNRSLMMAGVTLQLPETITVTSDSTVGRDCQIEKCVTIAEASTVGEQCLIRQGAIVRNCTIGNSVVLGAYSVLENMTIADGAILPPFSTSIAERQ